MNKLYDRLAKGVSGGSTLRAPPMFSRKDVLAFCRISPGNWFLRCCSSPLYPPSSDGRLSQRNQPAGCKPECPGSSVLADALIRWSWCACCRFLPQRYAPTRLAGKMVIIGH